MSLQDNIRSVLTNPMEFEALEPDGSTQLGLSEQVLAAMARAALTKAIAGAVFNEITAHRDESGQLIKIEVDYMDKVHDPAPRSAVVDLGADLRSPLRGDPPPVEHLLDELSRPIRVSLLPTKLFFLPTTSPISRTVGTGSAFRQRRMARSTSAS